MLSRATWADNLADVVDAGVVRVGYVNLFLFLRWLVVWWGHVARVHRQNLVDESQPFFNVFISLALVTGVAPEACLPVVGGFGGRASDIGVVCLKILDRNSLLEVVDPMSADPNLYFKLRVVSGEIAEALRGKRFQVSRLPPFLQPGFSFMWLLPTRHARGAFLVELGVWLSVFSVNM